MGGHRQSRTRTRKQDEHRIYESATLELANELGWEHGVVLYFWSQVALAREACGEPRPIAEYLAMRNIVAVFDRRGAQSD